MHGIVHYTRMSHADLINYDEFPFCITLSCLPMYSIWYFGLYASSCEHGDVTSCPIKDGIFLE
jgi:hypothetical protein